MKFDYADLNQKIVTLFIQEMLRRGYLASTSVYLSNAHAEQIIDEYLEAVDDCFLILAKAIENDSIDKLNK